MGRLKKRAIHCKHMQTVQQEKMKIDESPSPTPNPIHADRSTDRPGRSSTSTPDRSRSTPLPPPCATSTPVSSSGSGKPLATSTPLNQSRSTVATKLSRLEEDTQCLNDTANRSRAETEGNLLIKFNALSSFITEIPCKECFNSKLITNIVDRRGLACKIDIYCNYCEETVHTWWTSDRVSDTTSTSEKHFQINREVVAGSLSCGMGATKLQGMCEQFNLPCLHHKSFQSHAEKLYSKNEDLRHLIFEKAVKHVRLEHLKLLGVEEDDGRTLDIAVSTDGTWLTRGHTSRVGAVFVIDILTGLVIDQHVMSTYCCKCDNKKRMEESSPEDYERWKERHIGSWECGKNYFGNLSYYLFSI